MNESIHCCIYGTVQGVSFRFYTQQQAESLKLSGWVRNRLDGCVETCVTGSSESIQQMLDFLHQGPPLAKVERVEMLPVPDRQDEPAEVFHILPTI